VINNTTHDIEKRMSKAIEVLRNEMGKIRTGRALPSLLDHVQVDYYGSMMPINQVASITSSDARTLMVTPWEKNMLSVIEKAILTSDLGLNPASTGGAIRVPMPPLTEDRRKELIRVVRTEAEQSRVAIRNTRRDANNQLKDAVKDKLISEDEERRAVELIQKITDKYIIEVDAVLHEKEKDLLEV